MAGNIPCVKYLGRGAGIHPYRWIRERQEVGELLVERFEGIVSSKRGARAELPKNTAVLLTAARYSGDFIESNVGALQFLKQEVEGLHPHSARNKAA